MNSKNLNKMDAANHKAFEKGQTAWRDNVKERDNPYPEESNYYIYWQQGWESERDVHEK